MSGTDRPFLGISLRILAGLLSAEMFIGVKAEGTNVPLGEVVFSRSFFAVLPLILFERLTLWRIGGVLVGFAGVMVLLWPELDGAASETGRLVGLGLGLVSAVLLARCVRRPGDGLCPMLRQPCSGSARAFSERLDTSP